MSLSALEWSPPSEFDEYRLVRPLGQGAMGQVYLARDLALDRLVAIKLIAAVDPDPVARQRFLTEARAIARLQHPNVVAVHRIGEVARRPYLVSEYVSGEGLDRLAKPVPWQRALDIGIDLARGLAAAHRRGVLHRDIKPANSMITSDGVAKLLDFGLAKLVDEAGEGSAAAAAPLVSEARVDTSFAATQTSPAVGSGSDRGSPAMAMQSPSGEKGSDTSGDMVGTPLYMAPELWLGQPASRRTDVFALGVLLYELVAGRQPRKRPSSLEELRRLLVNEDATPLVQVAPPGVHAGLAAVIMRCLARDPAERWDSGDALCTALEQVRAGTRAGELPAGNPYRGLAPFDTEHRSLFFGRGAEVREVVDRLRFEPFVLVAGDSGVGKSSLCRAGVLPVLRDGAAGETAYRVHTLLPGKKPFSELVMLLALESGVARDFSDIAPDELVRQLGRTILFVDQLEEVITLAEPDEAARFAEALAALAASRGGTRLLATVRGDFATRLAALPALGPHVSRALYILRPLDEEGLRDAVTGPARAKGFELESPAMVESLVASSGGGLPLLQFTLAALWDHRDEARRVIPARALDDIGGAEGALARHADAAIDRMLPAERPAAWTALDRLVTHEGTRAVMTRAELESVVSDAPQVIERLVAARLLVAAEERITLVHEALVTAWPRLVAWRRDHAEGSRLRDQLGEAARQWDVRGRPHGLLWRDEALAEYRLWRARHAHRLTAVEEAFAEASLADAVRARRRRTLAISFAFAALLVGVVVLLYFNRQATLSRREAEDRLANLYVEQGRQAFLGGTSLHGLVYLAEAHRLGVDTPALRVLAGLARRTLDAQDQVLRGHRGKVWWVAWSPDGTRLATGGQDGTVRVWDAASGKLERVLEGHKADVMKVEFSPDGSTLLSVSIDASARLWEVATGRTLAVLIDDSTTPNSLRCGGFSPNGALIVTGGDDGTTRVWGRDGKLRVRIPGSGFVVSATFAPNGDEILTARRDRTQVWSAATGVERLTLTHPSAVTVARYDRTGSRIVTADHDGTARIWDAGSGALQLTLSGHLQQIEDASFSPDGSTVVTAGSDMSARIWDARDGSLRSVLLGHTGIVQRVEFTEDGRSVLTVSRDGTGRLWEMDSGLLVASLQGHAAAIWQAAVGTRGRIASASWDGTVRLWTSERVQLSRSMEPLPEGDKVEQLQLCAGDTRVFEVTRKGAYLYDAATGRALWNGAGSRSGAVSRDGHELLVVSPEGRVARLDAKDGHELSTLAEASDVEIAAFDTTGARIVSASGTGTVSIWDAGSGKRLAELGPAKRVEYLALLRNGTRLLSMDTEGIRLWDVATAKPIAVLAPWVAQQMAPAFDRGETMIVAGGIADNVARLWDAATGALITPLVGHLGQVVHAEFSPDRQLVATAGQDGTVKIWRAPTGTLLASLEGHGASIWWVTFSPDQALIISASHDKTARLWDAATYQQLATLRGHTDTVYQASFSSDSNSVVTAGFDKRTRIWSIAKDTLNFSDLRCTVPFYLQAGRILPLTGLPKSCN